LRRRPVVAIDGPAGAGKTTVTRRVAQALGYLLLGTGALYRAVALAARRDSVAWDDAPAVGAVARRIVEGERLRIARADDGQQRVLLDGEDVTEKLHAEEMGGGASQVSAVPAVREALLDVQREAGRNGGIVAEGRDVGTVVFPDAEAKFFLTASVQVRAQRRYDEMRGRGIPAELSAILRDVEERDRRDSTREVAPLVQASDAILVDSSALGPDEVVARIVGRVREIETKLGSR
jgi:cytidylate kinase